MKKIQINARRPIYKLSKLMIGIPFFTSHKVPEQFQNIESDMPSLRDENIIKSYDHIIR